MATASSFQTSHVYCPSCAETIFFDFDIELIKLELIGTSGLAKKTLFHGDHVLIVDIDRNGTIRNEIVSELLYNPLQTLLKDITHTFLYLETEENRAIHIDAYTSNIKLTKFLQSIISNIFDMAIGKDPQKRLNLKAISTENMTILDGTNLHFRVGPFINEEQEKAANRYQGIILDIEEAEKNKLNIEATFEKYDWVALIVPKNKKEGYLHAFSSLFSAQQKPFFVDILTNQSLKRLFDFVFAVIYGLT